MLATLSRWRGYVPGLLLAMVIALAATFMTNQYGGPRLIYALFFGIAFHFLAADAKTKPGIEFAARTVLRLGVALLGARIVFAQIAGLGWLPLVLVAIAVMTTLVAGTGIAQLLSRGQKPPADKRLQILPQGLISSGAVAICGASAALAIAAVMPRRAQADQFTILVIVGVTSLSTLAMVLYPALSLSLGLTEQEAGIFLGGSIHDVAQVVGAGYTLSTEAGDTATIVKLFRVALLLPVVMGLSLLFRAEPAQEGKKSPPLIPLFLVGFLLLAGVNSLGLLPSSVSTSLTELSRWCLVIAISALGVKTSFQDMLALGWRPIAMLMSSTIIIAVVVLTGVMLLA